MIETIYILGAIAAFCAATGAYVIIKGAIQLYTHVVSWFRMKLKIGDMNPFVIATTIRERLSSGDYGLAQCLYDQNADKILDARRLKGDALDEDLARLHRSKDMVVYT